MINVKLLYQLFGNWPVGQKLLPTRAYEGIRSLQSTKDNGPEKKTYHIIIKTHSTKKNIKSCKGKWQNNIQKEDLVELYTTSQWKL